MNTRNPSLPGISQNDSSQINLNSLTQENATESNAIQIPEISLPKGGGALKGIDEKSEVNAANGTSPFDIPRPITPTRNRISSSLFLSYNLGGNSLFGSDWSISYPSKGKRTNDYQDMVNTGQKIFLRFLERKISYRD